MPTLAQHFLAMARNNLWSNHRLHAACAGLSPHDYFLDRGAFFRSIHGTLNHILLVDRAYLAILAGAPAQRGPLDRELHAHLASLTAAQTAADRQLLALCESLTAERLAAVVRWTGADGGVSQDPVHAVLSHLFIHQVHHRGQVHNMLSATGVKPPQLDEFFLSQDAPLREGELRKLGVGG